MTEQATGPTTIAVAGAGMMGSGIAESAAAAGLGVISVCESLYDEFKEPGYAPPPLLKRMVVTGRLGRKTGRGFYDY